MKKPITILEEEQFHSTFLSAFLLTAYVNNLESMVVSDKRGKKEEKERKKRESRLRNKQIEKLHIYKIVRKK